MFLASWCDQCCMWGFPHAGGDVSKILACGEPRPAFSPRRWGCFFISSLMPRATGVFPTQVGMFPATSRWMRCVWGFPHAGGDVSGLGFLMDTLAPFSPRRWGCFQQTTLASMQSIGFPHAGGDVSVKDFGAVGDGVVFPTQVGMFLKYRLKDRGLQSFPHAGGDVSTWHQAGPACGMFSPRRWGCFSQTVQPASLRLVFPTQVGMFPSRVQRHGT